MCLRWNSLNLKLFYWNNLLWLFFARSSLKAFKNTNCLWVLLSLFREDAVWWQCALPSPQSLHWLWLGNYFCLYLQLISVFTVPHVWPVHMFHILVDASSLMQISVRVCFHLFVWCYLGGDGKWGKKSCFSDLSMYLRYWLLSGRCHFRMWKWLQKCFYVNSITFPVKKNKTEEAHAVSLKLVWFHPG